MDRSSHACPHSAASTPTRPSHLFPRHCYLHPIAQTIPLPGDSKGTITWRQQGHLPVTSACNRQPSPTLSELYRMAQQNARPNQEHRILLALSPFTLSSPMSSFSSGSKRDIPRAPPVAADMIRFYFPLIYCLVHISLQDKMNPKVERPVLTLSPKTHEHLPRWIEGLITLDSTHFRLPSFAAPGSSQAHKSNAKSPSSRVPQVKERRLPIETEATRSGNILIRVPVTPPRGHL